MCGSPEVIRPASAGWPETVNRPRAGWFTLAVMRNGSRGWDWSALMIDVEPDDLKNCACDFPALFYVDPNDYHPGEREAHQCYVAIPGKHRSRDAAWAALDAMIAASLN